MEPGSVPGTFRFSLTTLYGSNFEGGHFTRNGTTTAGQSVRMPLYRHEVSLDYARVELELQYTATPEWDVVLRLPWERKQQNASVHVIDPATPDQQSDMQRNVDLHHRNGTFTGISDFMLLGRRRWLDRWRTGDTLRVGGGITLPTGRTVENPYLLGKRGIQHLHIQFGSGTFDPLLEGSYSVPLSREFSAGGYVATLLPLYENRRKFRAPPEATAGVSLSHRTTDRVALRLDVGAFVQGYGYWDGERDENTGLIATSIAGGATMRVGAVNVNADLRYPLSQRTLTEGDAFKQGPMLTITVGGSLGSFAR